MLIQENINSNQISLYLNKIINGQTGFEKNLDKKYRKQNGVFLTNSLITVENILSIIEIDNHIFNKRILEPSCGQGIFILKLIADLFQKYPNEKMINRFISDNLFFVDVQEDMIEKTKSNIRTLYKSLFGSEYTGTFNSIKWDFTDKAPVKTTLFFHVDLGRMVSF